MNVLLIVVKKIFVIQRIFISASTLKRLWKQILTFQIYLTQKVLKMFNLKFNWGDIRELEELRRGGKSFKNAKEIILYHKKEEILKEKLRIKVERRNKKVLKDDIQFIEDFLFNNGKKGQKILWNWI